MIFVLMEEPFWDGLEVSMSASHGARLTSHDADTVKTLLCTG